MLEHKTPCSIRSWHGSPSFNPRVTAPSSLLASTLVRKGWTCPQPACQVWPKVTLFKLRYALYIIQRLTKNKRDLLFRSSEIRNSHFLVKKPLQKPKRDLPRASSAKLELKPSQHLSRLWRSHLIVFSFPKLRQPSKPPRHCHHTLLHFSVSEISPTSLAPVNYNAFCLVPINLVILTVKVD